MERKFANYSNSLPILTKTHNTELNKFRDLYISIKVNLKYKILAIIKNNIKNKKTTGVPTSYQSRYFTNLD